MHCLAANERQKKIAFGKSSFNGANLFQLAPLKFLVQGITLPNCVHSPMCKPTHILQAHLALLSMACNL